MKACIQVPVGVEFLPPDELLWGEIFMGVDLNYILFCVEKISCNQFSLGIFRVKILLHKTGLV